MSDTSEEIVRLCVSYQHDEPVDESLESSFRKLILDTELTETNLGWTLQSLKPENDRDMGQGRYRKCIATLQSRNTLNIEDPMCDVDALCNALTTIHFSSRLRKLFGGFEIRYYPDAEDSGSALGEMFAVRFAVATLSNYPENNELNAQIVLHQLGVNGFISRNPSKWIDGYPRAIYDIAEDMADKGNRSIQSIGKAGSERKATEYWVGCLKYGTEWAETTRDGLAPFSEGSESNARQNIAKSSGSLVKTGTCLYDALCCLQADMACPNAVDACHTATSSFMAQIGRIFPLSLDFSDKSFAPVVANSGAATVATAVAVGMWVGGGPVPGIVASVLIAAFGLRNANRSISKWWRNRGLSLMLLDLSNTAVSCFMLLQILAVRRILITMRDRAEADRLDGLLLSQLGIAYEKLNEEYVHGVLATFACGLRTQIAALKIAFESANLLTKTGPETKLDALITAEIIVKTKANLRPSPGPMSRATLVSTGQQRVDSDVAGILTKTRANLRPSIGPEAMVDVLIETGIEAESHGLNATLAGKRANLRSTGRNTLANLLARDEEKRLNKLETQLLEVVLQRETCANSNWN